MSKKEDTYTNSELRQKVIQVLKRYKIVENGLVKHIEEVDIPDPQEWKDYMKIDKIWCKYFKRDYINFLGILSDLKIIPKIGERRDYKYLEKYFKKWFNEHYSNVCLISIIEAPKEFQGLLSHIKSEFQITEDDLLDNKETPDTDERASIPDTKSNGIAAISKHQKELKELDALYNELTSGGFLKRQVGTIRDTMHSIAKNIGYVLQAELFEGNLTEENRGFLDSTYEIKKKLKNMPGSVQLDKTTEAFIREYSFELNSFIKRQKENREIA